MASRIYPEGADPITYQGLASLYEYINCDGEHRRFNCGQAAACTFLTHHQILPVEPAETEARSVMCGIESNHPPDNFGGWFGTSRKRVERICRDSGLPVEEVAGEAELRQRLADRRPVIVMLGTQGKALFAGLHAPAGHWMVAYGFDERQIFLSNYSTPSMPWEEFRRGWRSLVPRLISMRLVGLGAITQIATDESTTAKVIV